MGDISTFANPEAVDGIGRAKKDILAADIPYNKELHVTFSCLLKSVSQLRKSLFLHINIPNL